MRRYSRLLSVEEKKHKRRALVYGVLSILLLLAFIFYGLPAVAKFSTVLSDLRPKSAEESDKTPPAKPRFLTQMTATNSAVLVLSGVDQPDTDISLFQNGKELASAKTSKEGTFKADVKLFEGKNSFLARAKNENGVESQNSETLEIILDTSLPEITITEPKSTTFTEDKITIKGSIDEEADIYINDRTVVLDDQNVFSQTINLSEGENKVTIKAIDHAGNENSKELIFTRS